MISLSDFAKRVRANGEVLLEQNLAQSSSTDEIELAAFLSNEFDKELLSAPRLELEFNSEAALWATKILYQAAHYVLNRKDEFDKISTAFNLKQNNLTIEEQFSADLMLRYLPDIIRELILIDNEDPLIQLLESQLKKSLYSAMLYFNDLDPARINELELYNGLSILVLERIIENKKWNHLQQNHLGSMLKTQIGLYSKELIGIENIEKIINASD